MNVRLRARTVFLIVAFLAPAGLFAQRSLHWRRMDVVANLDAQGVLHVAEKQAMVFTGDWNGGERTFRVAAGQKLNLTGVSRKDENGRMHALMPGDLDEVDHYKFTDPVTLRWRSRRPSDPPFDKTEILYELDYTLSGILAKEGDRYVLNHDFAFPDRVGAIDAFSLELTLDACWKPDKPVLARYELNAIPPGLGFVLRRELEYSGSSLPASVRHGTSRAERWAAFLILLGTVLLLGLTFLRRESSLGRFAPLPPESDIDARWLEKNVFSLLPEEAGALWDETIGAPEVAALLARLTAEKKIATQAEGKKLTMRLLVPLSSLAGYEKDLLNALFFSDRKETDTDAIKAHYRSKGFDPSSKIKEGLAQKLASHPDFQDRTPRPLRLPTLLLVLGGLALVVAGVVFAGAEPTEIAGAVIGNGLPWAIAIGFAYVYQKRVHDFLLPSLAFLWVPALFLYFSFRAIGAGGATPFAVVAGVLLIRIGIVNNLFNVAKTRNGPHRLARRRTLFAARRWFAKELDSREPRLEDSWFPYIVAFGLAGGVEKWFRAYGGAAASRTAVSTAHSSSSSSSSSSGGWTGGGGSFGGAGASSSWAVAAGALAAGVSAPSTGGSGGGGGGGSSGGGGGGGW